MSNVDRSYRVRVGKRGSSDLTASTHVAFTVSTTGGSSAGFLTGLDRWGGQEIRPTDGKVVSRPWTVTLGESQAGEEITPKLMDGGRAAIVRRLLDLSARPSTDTTWTSTHIRATGRVTDVQMGENIGTYNFTVQDERVIEREATIFTDAIVDPSDPDPTDRSKVSVIAGSSALSVYPHDFVVDWAGFRKGLAARYYVSRHSTGNLAHLFKQAEPDRRQIEPMSEDVEQLVLDDLFGTRRGLTLDNMPGPKYLRTTAGGADVNSTDGDFRTLIAEVDGTDRPVRAPGLIHRQRINSASTSEIVPEQMFVVWASSLRPAQGTEVKVRLMMPTHAPDPALPKLLAGTTNSGDHPVDIATDIWDELGVRYSSTQTAALSGTRDTLRGPLVVMRADQTAADWMQERLWTHSLIAPVVDPQGRVSPRSIALPTKSEIPTLSALQLIGSSNTAEHPTWAHASNEVINVLRARARRFGRSHVLGLSSTREAFRTVEDAHDTASTGSDKFLGRHPLKLQLPAFADPDAVDFLKTQFFTRYGDGPVRSEVTGLEELTSVQLGHFVRVGLDTFPNLGSSGRGGLRLMQVTSRTGTKSGPRFALLDAGEGSTVSQVSTPTVAVSRSTVQPRHQIDVAVSTTGSGYVLQHAESTGQPASGSTLWDGIGGDPDSGSTYTARRLASGAKHWFRAAARAPLQVASTWSAPGSTTTEGLTAVTSFASSGVTACSVDLSIVPSMSDYPIEIRRGSTRDSLLPVASSGSTVVYTPRDISDSTSITFNARHIDAYGGASTDKSVVVSPSTTVDAAGAVDFTFARDFGTT